MRIDQSTRRFPTDIYKPLAWCIPQSYANQKQQLLLPEGGSLARGVNTTPTTTFLLPLPTNFSSLQNVPTRHKYTIVRPSSALAGARVSAQSSQKSSSTCTIANG
eukprot:gb/GEZJ01001748.1/.p2 GENE.gb/GEZJ01001748.1/~~gb/GEZJ01001748.1/.p2  ORF type:complete len:105 (+),score=5.83 gb/GEZJ01001748.1/:1140-1454(+)